METISKVLLMLVLFLCVDLFFRAQSTSTLSLPSKAAETFSRFSRLSIIEPLSSASGTLLLFLYKSSSLCVAAIPTAAFDSNSFSSTTSSYVNGEPESLHNINSESKKLLSTSWSQESSVLGRTVDSSTLNDKTTEQNCKALVVTSGISSNYQKGLLKRTEVHHYRLSERPPPLEINHETTIFGYKIYNPFTVFERISGSGSSSGTSSNNLNDRLADGLAGSEITDQINGFQNDGKLIEDAISSNAYYSYDENSSDLDYYHPYQSSSSILVDQNELNALKLLCSNTTITAVNDELKLRKDYNKYVYLLLQRCRNVNNSSLKLEQFENIYHLEWSYSDLDDRQLSEVFINFNANFEYLEYLDLTDNRINCLNWARTQIVRRLKVLILTSNRINSLICDLTPLQNMNLLIELRLDENHLTTLHGGYFLNNLSELKALNLSRNRLIDLPRHTFDGVFKLERLYISHNLLRVLPFQLFRTMTDLRVLDLSHNSLLSFPENFFAHNEQLLILRLKWNNLQIIGKNTFYNLRRLIHLDLSHNDIDYIDRKAFESLQSLKTLNISINNITTISSILFQSLPRLQQLDLSYNPLKQLPSGIFMNQRNLVSLHLDGTRLNKLNNWISRSEPNYVDGGRVLKRLTYVSMQHNPYLQTLSRTLFLNAPNIRVLLLAHNSLRQLPKEIESLHYLEHFNVAHNNLTYLPESLRYLSHLRFINILQNDYICDCKLYWLANWLHTVNNSLPVVGKSNSKMNQSYNNSTFFYDDEDYAKSWSTIPYYMEHNLNLLVASLKCRHGYKGDMIAILKTLSCTVPHLQNVTESRMYELHTTAKLDCTFSGSPSPDVIWVNSISV